MEKLRAGSMLGYTFNRQKPLKRYIVDFYCKPLNLVIEVDGGYHEGEVQKIKDSERQQVLEEMGLNFLRFSDKEVRKNIDSILRIIKNYIFSIAKPRGKFHTIMVFRSVAVVSSFVLVSLLRSGYQL